jgi:hypothetical protein
MHTELEIRNPEGKSPLGYRRRRDDDIKTDLNIGFAYVDRIQMTQNTVR